VQAQKLMSLTTDQETRLFLAEKRNAELEQKLSDMASLSAKVYNRTRAQRGGKGDYCRRPEPMVYDHAAARALRVLPCPALSNKMK